eukprot:TRINITY_DN19081_c0_g1_i1.p1 TRINITY_DN19081_c0_g1~~TRINITY_DN19081_c0_g1_i1.p1  ORF type:complete len:590 (-),score=50.02 TRINITY_DN19081_c0_g1_i1:45-1784(-)
MAQEIEVETESGEDRLRPASERSFCSLSMLSTRSRALVLISLLFVVAGGVVIAVVTRHSRQATAVDRRPNLMIIIADDMGWGDLASYGHPSQEVGGVDRLASEGMRFTNWYSADSVCTPSRGALLTGRLPARIGLVPPRNDTWHSDLRVFVPTDKTGLPTDETTLAEVLSQHGYYTGLLGKWHLGINRFDSSDGTHLPHNHGFQYVGHQLPFTNHWNCDESGLHRPQGPDPFRCFLYRNATVVQQPLHHETLTTTLVADAKSFMAASDDAAKPFFLYLAFPQMHESLFASATFRNTSRRGLYGDMLREMQSAVDEVATAAQGITGRPTVVLFLSDHGPHIELCSEGGSAGPFSGGKSTSWEGGFRVPAVLWGPGLIPSGITSGTVASSLDVFPTFLELAGVEIPSGLVLDGSSMKSAITSQETSCATNPYCVHETLFFYCADRLMAVREGRYKLHYFTQPRPANATFNCVAGIPFADTYYIWDCFSDAVVFHDPPLVYDIEADPGEQWPLEVSGLDALLQAVAAKVLAHNETLVNRRSPILDQQDPALQPCCNPPSCVCNFSGAVGPVMHASHGAKLYY